MDYLSDESRKRKSNAIVRPRTSFKRRAENISRLHHPIPPTPPHQRIIVMDSELPVEAQVTHSEDRKLFLEPEDNNDYLHVDATSEYEENAPSPSDRFTDAVLNGVLDIYHAGYIVWEEEKIDRDFILSARYQDALKSWPLRDVVLVSSSGFDDALDSAKNTEQHNFVMKCYAKGKSLADNMTLARLGELTDRMDAKTDQKPSALTPSKLPLLFKASTANLTRDYIFTAKPPFKQRLSVKAALGTYHPKGTDLMNNVKEAAKTILQQLTDPPDEIRKFSIRCGMKRTGRINASYIPFPRAMYTTLIDALTGLLGLDVPEFDVLKYPTSRLIRQPTDFFLRLTGESLHDKAHHLDLLRREKNDWMAHNLFSACQSAMNELRRMKTIRCAYTDEYSWRRMTPAEVSEFRRAVESEAAQLEEAAP